MTMERQNGVWVSVPTDCHDCGAKPGEEHGDGCDVERCSRCAGQFLSCGCPIGGQEPKDAIWTGIWPGEKEAVERGWFARRVRGQWERCEGDAPGARPDLNREQTWAVKQARKHRSVS